MYSLRMSVWQVPRTRLKGTPCFLASARYMASSTGAGRLMVMDVDTLPMSMPEKRVSMSARLSTATPSRPTSPSERGSSESRPISVGRSKAVDRPVWPCSSRYLKRSLVSLAVLCPANMRMVHGLVR
jgi:hypothetical protein